MKARDGRQLPDGKSEGKKTNEKCQVLYLFVMNIEYYNPEVKRWKLIQK